MLVTRRTTPRPLDPFDRAFQQLTAGFFAPSAFSRRTTPTVDAAWRDDVLELTVDLPGVPKDAVAVEVADRQLTISVEHVSHGETLRWSRALQLGGSLDPEGVRAHYADGRLTVTIPPMASPEARRVEISDAPSVADQPTIEAHEAGEAPTATES